MRSNFSVSVTKASRDIVKAQQIRREVFVEEQGLPAHVDFDGNDEAAFHVLCQVGSEVIGTGRLLALDNDTGSLGKIAVLQKYRGNGLERLIVQTLEAVAIANDIVAISLKPHKHLDGFYQSLGYHVVPGIYVVGTHEFITMRKHFGRKKAKTTGE